MLSLPQADGVTFAEVVDAVREHTHVLLGTTIGYSEEDWAAPTRLVGWTRSHVAAHLAQNAEGFARVCDGVAAGRPERMYPSDRERMHAIELGALADGLTLQINLDTTAGRLQEQFSALEESAAPVTLRAGLQLPADQIPLARLHEVVLHSFDLDLASPGLDVAPNIAVALLAFEVSRVSDRPDLPRMVIRSDEGFTGRLGRGDGATLLTGPASDLLAWLARGVTSERLVSDATPEGDAV